MLGKKLGENSIFNKIKKLNLDLLMVFSFELSTVGTYLVFQPQQTFYKVIFTHLVKLDPDPH